MALSWNNVEIDLHKVRNNELASVVLFTKSHHFWSLGLCSQRYIKGTYNEGGTNLWVFENLIFFSTLLKEDFVLAVPRPGEKRLHKVLVVFKRPLCRKKSKLRHQQTRSGSIQIQSHYMFNFMRWWHTFWFVDQWDNPGESLFDSSFVGCQSITFSNYTRGKIMQKYLITSHG